MNNKDVQVAATEIFNACSRVCPSSPLLSSSDDKKHTLVALIDYGCHAGLQNYNEQVTGSAWSQHAVGLEPSPNVRYYISPLLTDSSMG